MRYHFEKPELYLGLYGKVYRCDHPVYDECTLYKVGRRGLAVIQQRFDEKTKTTRWGPMDISLIDAIYLHEGFGRFFAERGGEAVNGIYPTVTVRQLMWALKMKPLKKERWETVFDRKDI